MTDLAIVRQIESTRTTQSHLMTERHKYWKIHRPYGNLYEGSTADLLVFRACGNLPGCVYGAGCPGVFLCRITKVPVHGAFHAHDDLEGRQFPRGFYYRQSTSVARRAQIRFPAGQSGVATGWAGLAFLWRQNIRKTLTMNTKELHRKEILTQD